MLELSSAGITHILPATKSTQRMEGRRPRAFFEYESDARLSEVGALYVPGPGLSTSSAPKRVELLQNAAVGCTQ